MEKIILHGARDYSDERGNRVIGYIPENVTIKFSGENALLEVGENFTARGEGNLFTLCGDGRIKLGNNVTFGEWVRFHSYEDGVIEVSNNTRFADGSFISVYPYARIFFGKGFSMEQGNTVLCLPHNLISFGNDTMMSRNVFVQSNDGHPIFDVNTGENLNCTEEICKKRKIIIGDHVWIGQSAILLYNTEVGNGSIIGAGSLVKGRFPNNCSIAGVPARIIKRDIAWSRHGDDRFEDIPSEWRKRTAEPELS